VLRLEETTSALRTAVVFFLQNLDEFVPDCLASHSPEDTSSNLSPCKAKVKMILTFLGPCIVNVFLSATNEMQRYTILFIVVSAVHVSSGSSAHHQELKNCTYSIGY
jgi:hypothetical protein